MAEITLPTEIRLDIVTPDRLVAHDAVTAVTIHGKNGYLGILPGHAPLLTELAPGELEYTSGGAQHCLAVNWGFAEVLGDRVIVLAQSAERAEEIDVERAEKAKTRAEERLKRFDDPQLDMERARKALTRAMVRLETAHKLGR
jgi:F-type H+-transporting ATPase subunit epsilon